MCEICGGKIFRKIKYISVRDKTFNWYQCCKCKVPVLEKKHVHSA